MTEQKQPQINNEAAFIAALGVDPDTVMAGSIKIEFQQGGVPVIAWVTAIPTNMVTLGAALLAAAQAPSGQEEETGHKQPQDRKRSTKKQTARKTAAVKKAVPKKEEAGESTD